VTLPFAAVANKTGATQTEQIAVYDVSLTTMLSPVIVFTQAPYTGVITVGCPASAATIGVPYSSQVTASGGVPPYFFVAQTALPGWLTLDFNTGAMVGTPKDPTFDVGTWNFTVQVSDSLLGNIKDVATANCTIVVSAAKACTYSIDGPADVPGLSSYSYAIHLAAGETATGISWTADKATASFVGAITNAQATLQFQNTQADFITVRTDFTSNGTSQCATKQVALVKVDVGHASFSNPGRALGAMPADRKVFLVNPPPPLTSPPAACTQFIPLPLPAWVTFLVPTRSVPDPGSRWRCFIYNGPSQAPEPRVREISNGVRGPAFLAQTRVTLTSPAEKPDAQQHIQVGFIQHGIHSGTASYPQSNSSSNLTRIVKIPATQTIDWLSSTPSTHDRWPWYDAGHVGGCPAGTVSTSTGSGTSSWSSTLCMSDSPNMSIPASYNPNDATDPNGSQLLLSSVGSIAFVIRIGARTLDTDLAASRQYFDEANSTWKLNIHWPVVPAAKYVVVGPDWTIPASASKISVNVVPTVTNGNGPFLRWKCATATCGI
jgi:hypothetical protein